MTPQEKEINKEECNCYGPNKNFGKQHCPIHRYTKNKKDCTHERLSIDMMDEEGNHRCLDCGTYFKPQWKYNLNRRYIFKKHLTGRWIYYLVDDDDEETIYAFLDNWIEKLIVKSNTALLNKIVEMCEEKSVKELEEKMGEAYNDLSVKVAYKEGYNKRATDIIEVIRSLLVTEKKE